MTENVETFDSKQMEILTEFPVEYDNDEEITVPQNAEKSHVLLARLGENLVIGYRWKKTGEAVGSVIFENRNILSVADGIVKLLNEEEPWNAPLEFDAGRDKVLITYSSSWAHNLPAPLERVNVYNHGSYEFDGLRAHDVWFSVPPKFAQKLADEIKKCSGNEEE